MKAGTLLRYKYIKPEYTNLGFVANALYEIQFSDDTGYFVQIDNINLVLIDNDGVFKEPSDHFVVTKEVMLPRGVVC